MFRCTNKNLVYMDVIPLTQHEKEQKSTLIELPDSVNKNDVLMIGTLKATIQSDKMPDLNDLQVGDKVLFPALTRDNEPTAETLSGQKYLEAGEYAVWIYAILAKFEY